MRKYIWPLLGVMVVACSAGDRSKPKPAPSGALPCEVERILTTVCQRCHSAPPRNGAPFSLVTYADTQVEASGAPISKYMRAALESGRMPLSPVTLSPEDRDVLLEWLRAGAIPEPTPPQCSTPQEESGVDAAVPDVDATIDGETSHTDVADAGAQWDATSDATSDAAGDCGDRSDAQTDDAADAG